MRMVLHSPVLREATIKEMVLFWPGMELIVGVCVVRR